ncbi:hypothetical protein IWX85_003352 [Polaromonas sp. CG_9.11]|nr:hypothetical protein [Polaromonas sp. CG_9.11]
MAALTPATLWTLKLSITTIPPARNSGAKNCSTQATKAWPLIGPSSTKGARSPWALNAQTNVVVCQCPHGA